MYCKAKILWVLLLASVAVQGAAFASAEGADAPAGNVIDIARQENSMSGDLDMLLAWMDRSDAVVSTLRSSSDVIFFAPNNAAMSELQELDTCGAIDLNENLVNTLLNYHIVRSDHTASLSEAAQTRYLTRLGAPLQLHGETVIDAAGHSVNITTGQLDARNGTMHVIDRVLWPYPAPKC